MAIRKIKTQTTWNDAAEAINDNFTSIGQQIDNITMQSIGVITPLDDTVSVGTTEGGITIGVNASALVTPNKGLTVIGNRIGVLIDATEGNRLTMTATGALRVESENFWAEIN